MKKLWKFLNKVGIYSNDWDIIWVLNCEDGLFAYGYIIKYSISRDLYRLRSKSSKYGLRNATLQKEFKIAIQKLNELNDKGIKTFQYE